MEPFSEIDLVISDINDNKIKLLYDSMLYYNESEYVVGADEDSNIYLFKVFQGASNEPELHDILDEDEFLSVREYYLSIKKQQNIRA